jgi:glucosamine kinase
MKLIAESGSTKTNWVVLSDEPYSFETEGLNPYYVSAEQIALVLAPYFKLESLSAVDEVYFYGTGITDHAKSEIIKSGIVAAAKKALHIETYSDIYAATRSLFGKTAGLACILGTGSNSCIWSGTDISFQIPPLGFWLGDEGSGGHLGKLLVLSYLHKEMPEGIRAKFEERFGVLDRLDVLQNAYKQAKPNAYFASFATFFSEQSGDSFLKNLLEKSFRSFFELYILKYPNVSSLPLGFVGSVAYYFQDMIRALAAEYKLNTPIFVQKPITGLVDFHREKTN